MASQLLASFPRQDLETLHKAAITEVKYLSSYNWIDSEEPTIVVPGTPPLWSPPKTLQKLDKDSGFIYLDQNAARHLQSPMEPLFRALYTTNPTFDITSTDIVTDTYNIDKLLQLVTNAQKKQQTQSFDIQLEVTENTLIMCTSTAITHKIIIPGDHVGYQNEFRKRYTTDRISNSTGSFRISSYRFCDLNFIIRHKIDAYVGTPGTDSLSSKLESQPPSSGKSSRYITNGLATLRVREEGLNVPHESIIRFHPNRQNKSVLQIVPKLWVSQACKLVSPRHTNGIFRHPSVADCTADINSWENANQIELKSLGRLIGQIRNFVKQSGGGRAVAAYNTSTGTFEIWKVGAGKMLPDDLYSKWNKGDRREPPVNYIPQVNDSPQVDDEPQANGKPDVNDELQANGKPELNDSRQVNGKLGVNDSLKLEVNDSPQVNDEPPVNDEPQVYYHPPVNWNPHANYIPQVYYQPPFNWNPYVNYIPPVYYQPQANDSWQVDDSPHVHSEPQVNNEPQVNGKSEGNDEAQVNGKSEVNGEAQVNGKSEGNDEAQVNGKSEVNGEAQVNGKSEGNDEANGKSEANDKAQVNGKPEVNDKAQANGKSEGNDSLEPGVNDNLPANDEPQLNGKPETNNSPKLEVNDSLQVTGEVQVNDEP